MKFIQLIKWINIKVKNEMQFVKEPFMNKNFFESDGPQILTISVSEFAKYMQIIWDIILSWSRVWGSWKKNQILEHITLTIWIPKSEENLF